MLKRPRYEFSSDSFMSFSDSPSDTLAALPVGLNRLFLGWWWFGSSEVPFGHFSHSFSCALRHETVQSNQIVCAQGEQKQGVDRRLASDLDLHQPAGQFDPTEDLFDALATSNAESVAQFGGDLVWNKPAADGALFWATRASVFVCVHESAKFSLS